MQGTTHHGVLAPHEIVVWFREELTHQLSVALAAEARRRAPIVRRARRAAARAWAPADAGIDDHRLPATRTIDVPDWFADAPFATGESNVPTLLVPDAEYVRVWSEGWHSTIVEEHDAEPYQIETWQVLDDAATTRWLHRDEESYRVVWSEYDEQRYLIGRLRWQVQTLARKHRVRSSEAVRRFPAARAAMQQALALKHRWNFQHELVRAGVTPTREVTGWCKAAFGRTFEVALTEIRSARVESQRQPFAAVRAGLL